MGFVHGARRGQLLGGLLCASLVLLAVLFPDPPALQSSRAPPEMTIAGARLFRLGLVFQGIVLLAVAVLAPRWQSTRAAGDPPLWSLSPVGARSDSIWLVCAVLALALLLRLIQLNSCLWYDEVVTLTASVRLPYSELVWSYPDQNQHPFYSLSARATVLLLGESPWT